jgi:hypothetical protein
MKQIFALSAAAMLLGVVSCSQEEIAGPQGDGNVTFTVTIPEKMGTRSFADGLTANDLQMAVYDAETGSLVMTPDEQKFSEGASGALTTTVSMNLASGRSYKIAFFAQHKDGGAYTFNPDSKTIAVNYGAMTGTYNTDAFDCFYTLYETGEITGAINHAVTLTRPVAQVNWGTSDLAEPAVVDPNAYGADAANLVSEVSTKAYTTFDMFSGDVTGEAEEVTLPYLARPADEENFPVQPDKYAYVSMQYLLVPAASSVIDITLKTANSTTAEKPLSTVAVTNVPVQANYRTNIYGALLTNPNYFTVTKDENWNDSYDFPVVPVEVKSNEELVAALQNGGNYVIPEGESLTMPDVTTTVQLSKPLKLQVNGTMSLTSGEDVKKYSNMTYFKVNSYVEIKGEGTIEANGGDFLFSCGNNGKLEIDGVDIVYNCQEKAANRAAINTGVNPVTIKNNTITTNCTAVRHNSSGTLTMENTTINVSLRSDGGNMWGAIESKGNVNLTNVKINSKARAIEIDVSPEDKPFDAMLKDCEFYAEADRVLYVSSACVAGSKLTIDGGKYSCKNSTGTKYEAPIVFDNNRGGKRFDCNIISGEFVKQPWGFLGGSWPNYTDDDPSVYLAPGSVWEEITPAATNPVYTWRVVKQ